MNKKKVTLEHTFEIDLDDIPEWLYFEVVDNIAENIEPWINGEGHIRLKYPASDGKHIPPKFSLFKLVNDFVAHCNDMAADKIDPSSEMDLLISRLRTAALIVENAKREIDTGDNGEVGSG